MKELNLKNVSYKEIEDFLLDIVESKKDITGETGEFGMLMFHKNITEYIEKISSGMVKTKTVYTEVSGPSNYQNQFIKYQMANGRSLTILHNPELDLRENQEIDDVTGFPIRSNILYIKE